MKILLKRIERLGGGFIRANKTRQGFGFQEYDGRLYLTKDISMKAKVHVAGRKVTIIEVEDVRKLTEFLEEHEKFEQADREPYYFLTVMSINMIMLVPAIYYTLLTPTVQAFIRAGAELTAWAILRTIINLYYKHREMMI